MAASHGLLGFLRERYLALLVGVLPLISSSAIFWAAYGSASVEDCSSGSFLVSCTHLTAGSTLYGYATEAWGGSISVLAAVWILLGLTLVGSIGNWIVSLQWSQDRGVTAWIFLVGLMITVGPWLGLSPSWGYALITACFWVSLVAALVLRDEVVTDDAAEWESSRQAAEEQARRTREQERERQREWDRAREHAESRTRWNREDLFDDPVPPTDARSRQRTSTRDPPRKVLDAAALLGVNATDSLEVIDAAYKSWAKSIHPDVNPNKKDATKQFQRINSAHDTLLEYKRRHGAN